jgi:hypothetical protein
MKKDTNIELVEKLLEKYKFTAPIPPDVRQIIIKRKRKDLVAILKKMKRYNRVIGASLFVFFTVKNFGISLSLYQSAVVVFLSLAIATASVSGGAYYAVKKYILPSATVEQPVQDTRDAAPEQKKEAPSPAPLAPAFVYLAPLEAATDVAKDAVAQVKTSFAREITQQKGPGSVAYTPTSPAGRGVAISLDKSGNSYTLSARLVDRATGRILHIYTETATRETLEASSRKIAQNIIALEK